MPGPNRAGKLAILLSKEKTCLCGQNGAMLVRNRNLIAKPCSNKWMPDEEKNPPAKVLDGGRPPGPDPEPRTGRHKEDGMKEFRLALLALLLIVPFAAMSHAQVAVGIGVGPAVVAAPYAYGPPVCDWGYYPYYPYDCAPYGYYGPSYFVSGVFIGVGPWYGWGWGHGYGHYGYGHGWHGHDGWHGGHGYGGGYGNHVGNGYRGGYGGTRPVYGGGGNGYAGGHPYTGTGYRGGMNLGPVGGGHVGGGRVGGGFSGGGFHGGAGGGFHGGGGAGGFHGGGGGGGFHGGGGGHR